MLQRLSLPLILLCTAAGAARAQRGVTIEQMRALVDQGRYAEAVDLLEPMLESKIESGEPRSRPSEELPIVIPLEDYLTDQYIAGHLEERGVAFLHRLYTAGIEGGKPRAPDLEERLIDLALMTGKLDIADAVVDRQRKRTESPEWELNQARVDASRGRTDEALAALRGYLDKDGAYSRSRILAMPGFAPLYENRSFRDMMAESEELVRRRYERFRSRYENDAAPLSAAGVLAAAALYAEVRDQKSADEMDDTLRAANRIVEPRAGRYREELFASLAERRGSPFYRLTVGRMLALLDDTLLARRVAAEVAGDDVAPFPEQFLRLVYSVARVDPEAARPLLRRLLAYADGSRARSRRFTAFDRDQMLIWTFHVAGDAGMEELEAAAAGSDSTASANAIHVLGLLFDPRLVNVLLKKIDATTDPAGRKRLIDRLSSIYLPETITALEALQARAASSSEKLAVRVGLKSLKRPTMPLPEKHGIAIADHAVTEILLRNLELTYGAEIVYLDKTILLSATKADIPALERIRRGIHQRSINEALYDAQAINAIILWFRWQ